MAPHNWNFTDFDLKLAEEIQANLPDKMFDFHAHLYRLEDIKMAPPHFFLEGPSVTSVEEWKKHVGRQVGKTRLRGGLFMPNPTPKCDITKANEFGMVQLKSNPESRGLLVVAPNSPKDQMETWLNEPGIVGFKPYHVFSAETPTNESSLEGYVPDWIWQMANERGLIITIHLVKKNALSDSGNQTYLHQQCNKYPHVKVVLAHCGRGFHAPNALKGVKSVQDLENIWFDTSAICEVGSIMAVLKAVGPRKLLWGSDFPVSEMRGKAITIGDSFYWLTSDMPAWEEIATCNPTLVGLESLRAICEAADHLDLKKTDLNHIFYENAMRLLSLQ